MALTAAQKKDVRKYLGVAFGFFDKNTRLESMLDKVGTDATDQAELALWLSELTLIDTALATTATSGSYSYGPLKKVDEVEFYDSAGSSGSESRVSAIARGRMLIKRIARALGVDDHLPNGDYFGDTRDLSVALRLG